LKKVASVKCPAQKNSRALYETRLPVLYCPHENIARRNQTGVLNNEPQPMHSPHCTIVITSCDRYADTWRPFATLFKHHWPGCPYETVLVTESPVPQTPGGFSRVVAAGKLGWGDRLALALSEIQTPRALLLCDDYFLCAPVDAAVFERMLGLAEKHNAGNLRLIPNPAHTALFSKEEGLGVYKPSTAYCIATQAGIWDTRFLQRIAKGYASIWEFERNGSFREDLDMPLLGTVEKVFPFTDAVHKGRWEEAALRLCREHQIPLDLRLRKKFSFRDRARVSVQSFVFNLNPNLVVRIQNALAGRGFYKPR